MKKSIFLTSLILTVLIFAIGVLLNYALDFVRIDTITDVIAEHEISTSAYLIEKDFAEEFGGDRCDIMQRRISTLKEEIRQVGSDLGSYSKFSWFKKKDYDYLKRKYFLLELKFLTLLNQINKECNNPYIPVIFFYGIDDDVSERQGFILSDLSKAYEQEVIVLSIDKDYEDEPLVKLLAQQYSITETPTTIIGSKKFEGLVYTGELNSTVRSLLMRADPYAKDKDFGFVINAVGNNREKMIANFTQMISQTNDPFAKADITLIVGRLKKNQTIICESLKLYDKALERASTEEKAIIYETIAAVNCGRNRKAFLLEAAEQWRKLGNEFRAEVDEKLAYSKPLYLKFNTSTIKPILPLQNASTVRIGRTGFKVDQSSLIVAQSDRVSRDWLGLQLTQSPQGKDILTYMSERLTYNKTELIVNSIGWHEGGRIYDFDKIGIPYFVATGTLAAKHNGKWYAVDDKGVFRFEVPKDKILYPTTRFLRSDIAVLIDTHGANMLVEQAIRNNATMVISCCDHPGKIKAAAYLSDNGINVLCLTDKFLYQVIGHNLSIVGSPPIKFSKKSAIIGKQPMMIYSNDIVIVMNATNQPFSLWYYQTPAAYFTEISKTVPFEMHVITINDFRQMYKIVGEARRRSAEVIAVRVYSSEDYFAVQKWLEGSTRHRAVLFHSASYPFGYKLINEFPHQVSFDDPNPIFK